MIKPDWNIFKAKFSGKTQDNFEWMCYLLFCNEHGKRTGIFKYKNQSAIETNPVTIDGTVIGWQAKFYETALSGHKIKILKMLDKVKKDYPDINKLYFYTNSEWGQSNGKEPVGKIEIERKAEQLSIELDWRCRSYFESPFVADDNRRVVSHFFSKSDKVVELLKSLEKHTESVLRNIETEIDFSGRKVIIKRSKALSDIESSTKQIVIVSGDAGTGKTALIKSLHKAKHLDCAFYVYRAMEFSVNKIEELLSNVSLDDFIDAHQGVSAKVVVVDSAENLLSIDNIDVFIEYVLTLLKKGWKIWLTTRRNSLNDLKYKLIDVCKIDYDVINLFCLTPNQLVDFAKIYNFELPKDKRLKDLISVPFYLNEYLRYFHESKKLNYAEFKNSLWSKVITKGQPERESQFIEMAVRRVNSGCFFDKCNSTNDMSKVIYKLRCDGIINYDSPLGYFITHDIYEDWALEKYLESTFITSESNLKFFMTIKQSLPIRRAFRKWLAEKLGNKNHEIFSFIQACLSIDNIPKLWVDEVLMAILLSDDSQFLFRSYKVKLLNEDCTLLKKICCLLRVGCKDVDDIPFESVGLPAPVNSSYKYLLTKPKGNGWESLIKFIFVNYSNLKEGMLELILPIIHEWNFSNRKGITTKYSSKISLRYYNLIITNGTKITPYDSTKKLIFTILYGAQEISLSLSRIIDLVIKNKWNKRNDPYNLLCQYILSKIECFNVARILPEKVIKLAEFLWTYEPLLNDDFYNSSQTSIDEHYGVARDPHCHFSYCQSSSLHTPVSILLIADMKRTLDFIIRFTNVATKKYASSLLGKDEVETVKVTLDNGKSVMQYLSRRLWCLYCGTRENPEILQSILMSLERYLLDKGKYYSPEELVTILYYILEHSKSAALSSLVSSIVIAFPNKTFQIAKILFRSKEFIIHDTERWSLDESNKTTLNSLKDMCAIHDENFFYLNDRVIACNEFHRKHSLENSMLYYQAFKHIDITEEDSKRQFDEISKILDSHYSALPEASKETDDDKIWRTYLARMDRRKMTPIQIVVRGKVMIQFIPEIDNDLKEYNENKLKVINLPYRHTNLSLWSKYRFDCNENYKKYINFESDPLSALHIAKHLWQEIKQDKNLINVYSCRYIPSMVCVVLLRDFCEKMDKSDIQFCKQVTLFYGNLFLSKAYNLEMFESVVASLSILTIILELFPEEESNIKRLMIFALLFDCNSHGSSISFNDVVSNLLLPLWNNNLNFALSVYTGYLTLAHKEKTALAKCNKEGFLKNFTIKHDDIFKKIDDKSISKHIIDDIQTIDVDTLSTAFQLVPTKIECSSRIPYIRDIITIISEKILLNERSQNINFRTRHKFLRKYTQYVLSLEIVEIKGYLSPFLKNFTESTVISELLEKFISTQDSVNNPNHFWHVWDLFKDKIIDTSNKSKSQHYSNSVIESYMFARTPWNANEWHTFSQDRASFFYDLTSSLGGDCSYLYSLSRFLCGPGSIYFKDGIFWLSSAVKQHEPQLSGQNKIDTIYYLEKYLKQYLFNKRQDTKRFLKVKISVIAILDFLIDNGSTAGYLLRRDFA